MNEERVDFRMELATGPPESNETPIFTIGEDCLLARR